MKLGMIVERVVIGLFLGVSASGLVLSPHTELHPVVLAIATLIICTACMLLTFSVDSDTD